MAGKRVKCPACAHVWQIPRQVVDAEAVPGTPGGASPASAAKKGEWFDDMMGDEYPIAASQNFSSGTPGTPFSSAAAGEPARRPCPRCGEMIAIGAAKCRFCDAIFDAKLRKSSKKKSRSGSSSSDDDLTTLDWIVCIFPVCAIGCIAGIIYMIQGKPKGIKMLGISVVAIIIWNIISFVVQMALVGPGRGGLH